MPKLGLVFAGGGGKGAYQIGVWRAMHQLGIDKDVCIASGTSVGALNAALFAIGDLAAAESVWNSLTPKQILFAPTSDAPTYAKKLLKPNHWAHLALPAATISVVTSPALGFFAPAALPVVGAYPFPLMLRVGSSFLPNLVARLTSGIITNEGLGNMIDRAVDFSRLAKSPVRCCATCCRLALGFPLDRIILGHHSAAYDRSVLLASSAIPLIFPIVQVDKYYYCDGGTPKIGDNVPIAPAYDAGCRNIIVVHLTNEPPTPQKDFPNANIIDIFPSQSLGGTAGTFDFTAEGARTRLLLGYEDGLLELKKHFS